MAQAARKTVPPMTNRPQYRPSVATLKQTQAGLSHHHPIVYRQCPLNAQCRSHTKKAPCRMPRTGTSRRQQAEAATYTHAGVTLDPDTGETHPGSYDGLRCAHESSCVFMMFYDVLTITSELWESVSEACLIVCPSAVIFGTQSALKHKHVHD